MWCLTLSTFGGKFIFIFLILFYFIPDAVIKILKIITLIISLLF